MKFKIYNSTADSCDEKEIGEFPSFDDDKGIAALRQVVLAHQANARQGNASTKTRAEVSGTGKKAFRQKGSGTARRGDRRSPILRKGGVAFGPKPRDYTQHLNRKVRQLALRRALFEQGSNGAIDIIEEWILSEPKTRIVNDIIGKIAPKGKILLLGDKFSNEALLASRNIPRLSITSSSDVNAMDLVHHDRIIISSTGMDKILIRANG
jgi:large subunit ribosomal protein L4